MPSSTRTSTSNSGIRHGSGGESFIPASVRADGSVRKEIRVKPGYKPPEDVELYKNRTAEAFKNRGVPGAGVPGAEPSSTTSPAKSKNAKRREAARQKAEHEDKPTDGETPAEAQGSSNCQTAQEEVIDEDAEKEKKARNLKKKLRQAKELQGKKEQGESLLPEQFAKVLKIQELIRDLDKLGFDPEGEKKEAAEEG